MQRYYVRAHAGADGGRALQHELGALQWEHPRDDPWDCTLG